MVLKGNFFLHHFDNLNSFLLETSRVIILFDHPSPHFHPYLVIFYPIFVELGDVINFMSNFS